jgi:hypothetical protein
LESPGSFTSFARKNCYQKHDNKCIDYIFGIKEGKSKVQAMRYKKDIWTASAARSHCSSHDGSFEASGASSLDVLSDTQLLQKLFDSMDSLKEGMDAINLTLKSVIDKEKDSVNSQVKTNDKVLAESVASASSVILDEAFIQGKKPILPDPQAKVQIPILTPKTSQAEGIKKLLVALKELKTAMDQVKNMR